MAGTGDGAAGDPLLLGAKVDLIRIEAANELEAAIALEGQGAAEVARAPPSPGKGWPAEAGRGHAGVEELAAVVGGAVEEDEVVARARVDETTVRGARGELVLDDGGAARGGHPGHSGGHRDRRDGPGDCTGGGEGFGAHLHQRIRREAATAGLPEVQR